MKGSDKPSHHRTKPRCATQVYVKHAYSPSWCKNGPRGPLSEVLATILHMEQKLRWNRLLLYEIKSLQLDYLAISCIQWYNHTQGFWAAIVSVREW